jgi:hypothetical protein
MVPLLRLGPRLCLVFFSLNIVELAASYHSSCKAVRLSVVSISSLATAPPAVRPSVRLSP